MKLKPFSLSYNGGPLARDEFAFRTIQGGSGWRPDGISEIKFWCPNGTKRICGIPLTLGAPVDGPQRQWHWDGNMEAPTITPSIGCGARCGWHGNIINGETHP